MPFGFEIISTAIPTSIAGAIATARTTIGGSDHDAARPGTDCPREPFEPALLRGWHLEPRVKAARREAGRCSRPVRAIRRRRCALSGPADHHGHASRPGKDDRLRPPLSIACAAAPRAAIRGGRRRVTRLEARDSRSAASESLIEHAPRSKGLIRLPADLLAPVGRPEDTEDLSPISRSRVTGASGADGRQVAPAGAQIAREGNGRSGRILVLGARPPGSERGGGSFSRMKDWSVASQVREVRAASATGTKIIESTRATPNRSSRPPHGAGVILNALNPPYTAGRNSRGAPAEAGIAAARASAHHLIFTGATLTTMARPFPRRSRGDAIASLTRKALRVGSSKRMEDAARDGVVSSWCGRETFSEAPRGLMVRRVSVTGDRRAPPHHPGRSMAA